MTAKFSQKLASQFIGRQSKLPRKRTPASKPEDQQQTAPAVQKQDDPIGTAKVTVSTLNVRKGPGTSYERMGGVSQGKTLQVYEEKEGWIKIGYGTEFGWVCAKYTDYVSKPPASTFEPFDATVTASSLWVRTGPSTDYDQVQALPQGTVVKVVGQDPNTGWYQIEYGSITGWMSNKYLEKTTEKPPSTPGDGQKAVDFAQKYYYSKTGLCTHDYCKKEPKLPHLSDFGSYNNNCANFVTAVMQNVGLISKHFNAVADLKAHCVAGKDGYREVSLKNAKPGDIWINKDSSHSHTEFVKSANGSGSVTLIGSNNVSTNNDKHGHGGSSYQKVTEATKSNAKVYSRQ
ncbi:MAG: SH3 domain-containing protein [Proteobacteria bacterium]|nr:SH3 domain-containing protein [Pseudomonadota bacterium]